MYRLCTHIDIIDGTPEERADAISKLAIPSLLHLLNCLPLDPLPPKELATNGSPYMVNSLRIGVSTVIKERADV